MIWAKLFVTDDYAEESRKITVPCKLGVASRAGFVGHTATVTVDNDGPGVGSKLSMALNIAVNIASTSGKVALRCRADKPGANLRWIKIMAMRVGTLSTVALDTGNKTTTGSGGPTAILGSRTGPIHLPKDEVVSLGKLLLPAGAWAIRTSFTLREDEVPFFYCRLNINGVSADSEYVSPDQPQSVIVMDTAVWSPTATAKVNVTCKGFAGPGQYGDNESVAEVRISALKLGTLTTFDLDGTAHHHGSGTPRASFRAIAAQALTSTQWMDVAWVEVGIGQRMVLAKADIVTEYDPAYCQLIAGTDYDQTEVAAFADLGVPFAVVHGFSTPGNIRLRCRAPSLLAGLSVPLSNIRLTAFELGSLQNVPI